MPLQSSGVYIMELILTCNICKYTEQAWRFKEEFNPMNQLSTYRCPKCKRIIYKPKRVESNYQT